MPHDTRTHSEEIPSQSKRKMPTVHTRPLLVPPTLDSSQTSPEVERLEPLPPKRQRRKPGKQKITPPSVFHGQISVFQGQMSGPAPKVEPMGNTLFAREASAPHQSRTGALKQQWPMAQPAYPQRCEASASAAFGGYAYHLAPIAGPSHGRGNGGLVSADFPTVGQMGDLEFSFGANGEFPYFTSGLGSSAPLVNPSTFGAEYGGTGPLLPAGGHELDPAQRPMPLLDPSNFGASTYGAAGPRLPTASDQFPEAGITIGDLTGSPGPAMLGGLSAYAPPPVQVGDDPVLSMLQGNGGRYYEDAANSHPVMGSWPDSDYGYASVDASLDAPPSAEAFAPAAFGNHVQTHNISIPQAPAQPSGSRTPAAIPAKQSRTRIAKPAQHSESTREDWKETRGQLATKSRGTPTDETRLALGRAAELKRERAALAAAAAAAASAAPPEQEVLVNCDECDMRNFNESSLKHHKQRDHNELAKNFGPRHPCVLCGGNASRTAVEMYQRHRKTTCETVLDIDGDYGALMRLLIEREVKKGSAGRGLECLVHWQFGPVDNKGKAFRKLRDAWKTERATKGALWRELTEERRWDDRLPKMELIDAQGDGQYAKKWAPTGKYYE
ncbi:hypothetical protein AURDEDRAFT_169333 [Auricularia subglabra TFB-10046 SS5]|nr:hypothetical protein AURDEDRAFT_169333 [Auricularia subglabra TFB-10046 SS5]